MYPEFSFDVIMIPWPLGIVLHQETFFFFQIVSCLNILTINPLASDSLEDLIQVDKVNQLSFILTSLWFISWPDMLGVSLKDTPSPHHHTEGWTELGEQRVIRKVLLS